jgi:hypothetical protein
MNHLLYKSIHRSKTNHTFKTGGPDPEKCRTCGNYRALHPDSDPPPTVIADLEPAPNPMSISTSQRRKCHACLKLVK